MSSISSPLRSLSGTDRTFAVIGSTSVGLTVAVMAGRLTGLLPSGLATAIVVAAAAVLLRIGLGALAKSASAEQRARTLGHVSTAGLAVSAVALVVALPVITRNGGFGVFLEDAVTHGWVVLWLLVLAAPVRTLTWRTLVPFGLLGFLALPALARTVGRPVIDALPDGSTLGPGVWAPLTETLLEAAPLVLFAALVTRRRDVRPAALDLVLLGACVGAGFALNEDALFGRGTAHWGEVPPLTLLFPTSTHAVSPWTYAAGHLVWVAFMGLGIAISALYRHRHRLARWAGPAAVALVLTEHSANNLVVVGGNTVLVTVMRVVTLAGLASTLLLLAGGAATGWLEMRALRGTSSASEWWRLSPELAGRRAQALARTQEVAR